jgi:hypothetical protein
MKRRILSLSVFAIIAAFSIMSAQQPQCPTCPIVAVNAKYVNGAAPGYAPKAGTGLTLNLSAGRVRCGPTMINYAGGTLTLANNTTNYVYLDTASSCVPASNTSGYSSGLIADATVVTSGGVITSITDDRTFGLANSTGGAIGTVSTTGSPASGNLSCFSGATSITNCNLSGDVTTSGTSAVTLSTSLKRRGIPFTIGDPAGSALTVASTTTDYFTVPIACTISGYNLVIAPSGTITVKFWKVATGTAIPTSGNSISTSGVGISTGTAIHSTTTSDFTTTTVSANDIVAMNVTAVSTASYVQGVLQCDQ